MHVLPWHRHVQTLQSCTTRIDGHVYVCVRVYAACTSADMYATTYMNLEPPYVSTCGNMNIIIIIIVISPNISTCLPSVWRPFLNRVRVYLDVVSEDVGRVYRNYDWACRGKEISLPFRFSRDGGGDTGACIETREKKITFEFVLSVHTSGSSISVKGREDVAWAAVGSECTPNDLAEDQLAKREVSCVFFFPYVRTETTQSSLPLLLLLLVLLFRNSGTEGYRRAPV